MNRILLIAVIFKILISPLAAETSDPGSNTDSDNFKKYSKLLTIRTGISRPILALAIRPVEKDLSKSEGKIIRYSPNTMENLNVALSWNGLGISLGRELRFTEADTDRFGKTEYKNYQLYYHSRNFGIDLFWQEYSGFYLLLPQRFGYEPGEPETRRSDLSIRTVGMNAFYSFSDNFSFSAAFDQSERQIKSGGSVMLMLSMTRFSADSSYSLIPPSQEIYFGKEAGYRGGDYSSAGISPGYGYTLIFCDNWFITAAAFLGGGWMHKDYLTNEGIVKKNEPFGRFNARASIGHNSDDYFFGILGIYDTTSADRWWRRDEDKIVVRADVIFLEFYAGMRFKTI